LNRDRQANPEPHHRSFKAIRSHSLISNTGNAFSNVAARRRSEVVVAYGPHGFDHEFDREGQIIRHRLRFASLSPIERAAITPETLKAEVLRQPHILYLAVHREMGTSRLSDDDGRALTLNDEKLAECLAPSEGTPNLIIVTGCNSQDLLPLLRARGIGGFIGFDSTLNDEDARLFAGELFGQYASGSSLSAGAEHVESYMARRQRPVPRLYIPEPYGSMRLT
jgi:hypothetical protein